MRDGTRYDTIVMDMSLYICPSPWNIQPRVNSNEKYRFWVIMMFQCRFISCNQCAADWDVDNGGGCVYGGIGCTGISVPFF